MSSHTQARVGVITYSTWSHCNTLADCVVAGMDTIPGVDVIRYNFKETLPQDVLTKMYAAPKPDHPDITPEELASLDGFIMCFGTRYGRAPAQVSHFFDSTGGQWAKGAYVGKFAGIVTSAGSQHGGHESTALTTLPFFAHHGIVFVPIGFAKSELSTESHIVGGSAWGASTVAGGQGQLPVLDEDKAVAFDQGARMAKLVAAVHKGKAAAASQAPALNENNVVSPSTVPQQSSNNTTSAEDPLAALNLGAPLNVSSSPVSIETEGYAVPQSSSTSATAVTPIPQTESNVVKEKEIVPVQEKQVVPVQEEIPVDSSREAESPVVPTTAVPVTDEGHPTATPAVEAVPVVHEKEHEVKPAPISKAVTTTQKKKKGGMFSMCCGGNGDDLKA